MPVEMLRSAQVCSVVYRKICRMGTNSALWMYKSYWTAVLHFYWFRTRQNDRNRDE